MESPQKRLYLLYHELVPAVSSYAYATSTAVFNQHLALFHQLHKHPENLQPGITFDDGHQSIYEHAMPALMQSGLTADLFITAGWIGRRPGYLNWPQLQQLQAAGHTVGAHGWDHALMTNCSERDLNTELVDARTLLEDKLGTSVTTLSFPGGRFDKRVLAAGRAAGYTHFFTSVPKLALSPSEELTGRVNIRQTMDAEWMRLLFTPGSSTLRRLRLAETAKSQLKRVLGDGLYAQLWSRLNHEPPASAVDLPPLEEVR